MWVGGLISNRTLERFQKGGTRQERGEEKQRGSCDPELIKTR